jgi:hypothetical protein
MKKILSLVFVFCVFLIPLSAKVITVDNNAGSVAQYSSLASAITEADPGDTLLIVGSPSSYGSHSIYKELHFIGVGYFLAENNIPGLSTNHTLAHITFKQDNSLGDSDNSSAAGISGALNSDPGVSGLIIDKCYSPSWNWRFQGQVTVTTCYTGFQV